VLSDIDWQELGFAKLLGFCNFGKQIGLELQEVMGVEVGESRRHIVVGSQSVAREEDIGDVLAKGTLEGLEVESNDLTQLSFSLILLIGCQESMQTLVVRVMTTLG
jgi:hypothetical protein